jgi:hypothetical protein
MVSRGFRVSLRVVRWFALDFLVCSLVGDRIGESSMKDDLKGSALSSSSITGSVNELFYSLAKTAKDFELIPDNWGLRNLCYFKSIGGF